MSKRLDGASLSLDPSAAGAALSALAGDPDARWALCDAAGRALVLSAGAGALLDALPDGWATLAEAILGSPAEEVRLSPWLSARLTRLSGRGEVLVRLVPAPRDEAEIARLALRMSGDAWGIVTLDGRVITLNESARVAVADKGAPEGKLIWELAPEVEEERWAGWVAALDEKTPRTHRSVELPRADRQSCPLHVMLRRDTYAGRPVVLVSARDLGLDVERDRELRERRAADELRAGAAAALAMCVDDELDVAVAKVLSVLGEHLGVRELRVLRCLSDGPVVGVWSWGDPDHNIPILSTSPPTQGLETTVLGDAVRICAVISDGGSLRGYLKALWSSTSSFHHRPLTTETLLSSTAELLGRAFARSDSAEAIRKNAASFREFVNNLPGLAFRSDIGDAYRFTLVSDGAVALTGFTPEQLLGRSFLELVHPDDKERVVALCAEQERAGDRFEMEYRMVTADGRERWVWSVGHKVYADDGTPLYAEGLLTDVTERRQVERERDLFFTSAQDAMAILNGAGRIKRGNPAFWSLFGVKVSPEDAVTVSVSQSSDPNNSLHIIAGALTQLVDAPHFSGVEGRYVTADGQERWVSWSGVVVHQPVTRIYIVGHDITRRHVEEEERRRLRERLAQMQRLEALGILAGGLAHDLNNVICVALGSLALLSSGPGHSPARARHIARVEGALERGSRIIDQLLSFGRRQVSQRAATDVNAVLTECGALARSSAPADVQITLDPSARALAWADAAQIEQVLMNLIMNALDALPRGGAIRLGTEDRVLGADEAQANAVAPGPYVVLRVQDDGVGIAEDLREQIFDPFFTTKSTGKGLGLSSAYGIVRAHDGALRVRAAAGGGSVFEVLLPVSLAPVKARDAAPLTPAPAPRAGHGATVLIVEDTPDLQETIALVLESVGYCVRLASSAEEARTALAAGPVDLLLTDVVMPGESGVSLARFAQGLYPGQRTVFMSGYAWNELVKTRSMPADALFLRKPFTIETLTRVVADVLAANQSAPAPG